jgi:hypothetical protein
LWEAPSTTAADRQAIVRQLVERVLITVQGDSEQVVVEVHWHGGDRTRTNLVRPVARVEQLSYYPQLMERVRTLHAQGHKSSAIAAELNVEGWRPAKRRQTFNSPMVQALLARQGLGVRSGVDTVRLYTRDYQLVFTHRRAQRPGERVTHPDHLPPEKLPGLLDRQASAADIGPATQEVVQTLLEDPVLDRLPIAGRLLRLRERFGDQRLEAACRRALSIGDPAYTTVKRILTRGLEEAEPRPAAPRSQAQTFVRSAAELVGHLVGGGTGADASAHSQPETPEALGHPGDPRSLSD